jgi:hypothetical protein
MRSRLVGHPCGANRLLGTARYIQVRDIPDRWDRERSDVDKMELLTGLVQ